MKMILVLLSLSFAYIPHSHFILKKSSDTHGKGTYKILQEVIFQSPEERSIVQETWWVNSGKELYVEAKGPQTSYASLYDEQTKRSPAAGGKILSSKKPANFFESFFHYRNANDFAKAILRAGIVGSEVLQGPRRFYNLKDVEYKGQNFVRLARTNGTIAYAFGSAQTGDTSNVPALWIEQDTFHLRRLRFKSGSEIMADEYEKYSKGLEFPRTRTLTKDGYKIIIRTLSVDAIRTQDLKDLLAKRAKDSPNQFGTSEVAEQIRKFYEDYR